MNRRYVTLSGLCVLAAIAAGCTTLSGQQPKPVVPPPLGSRPANGVPPPAGNGGVIPAGGLLTGDSTGTGEFDISGGQPVGAYQPQLTGQPLSPPRPAMPPSGGPMTLPPLPTGVQSVPGYPIPGDPHTLTRPTASGKILDLAPHETPTERVLELARHLELVLAQNRDLTARIKELEQLGGRREQALVEAIREVEAAENEVAKTRGLILTQKSEIATLQDKIRQMEREDIDLLKQVIFALEKLLPSTRREP